MEARWFRYVSMYSVIFSSDTGLSIVRQQGFTYFDDTILSNRSQEIDSHNTTIFTEGNSWTVC